MASLSFLRIRMNWSDLQMGGVLSRPFSTKTRKSDSDLDCLYFPTFIEFYPNLHQRHPNGCSSQYP